MTSIKLQTLMAVIVTVLGIKVILGFQDFRGLECMSERLTHHGDDYLQEIEFTGTVVMHLECDDGYYLPLPKEWNGTFSCNSSSNKWDRDFLPDCHAPLDATGILLVINATVAVRETCTTRKRRSVYGAFEYGDEGEALQEEKEELLQEEEKEEEPLLYRSARNSIDVDECKKEGRETACSQKTATKVPDFNAPTGSASSPSSDDGSTVSTTPAVNMVKRQAEESTPGQNGTAAKDPKSYNSMLEALNGLCLSDKTCHLNNHSLTNRTSCGHAGLEVSITHNLKGVSEKPSMSTVEEKVKGKLKDLMDIDIANTTTKILCPRGTIEVDKVKFHCMGCPKGHFMNESNGCQPCPPGFFQDAPMQLECKPCPKLGAISMNESIWEEVNAKARDMVYTKQGCPELVRNKDLETQPPGIKIPSGFEKV